MGFPTFTPLNTFNQGQVDNATNDYNNQHQAALTANQNLQDYQKNMVDPSKMYQTNLDNTNQSIGFDPKQLAAANQQLATTQNQVANLPQSIAAQGGGYGVTAGQMANNYTQSMGNLHTALADQGNNVNALQSTYQNALKQAGDQTNFGVQGQQMHLSSLNDVFKNAQDIQNSSLQNMQFLEDQFQKQGQFNADQARQYAASYAQYQQALAAANQANAQAGLFGAQKTAYDQANAVGAANALYTKNANNSGGFNFYHAGQPITVQQYNAARGTNIDPMIGQNPVQQVLTSTY